jgi:outer membrane protein OmpA-like peptidoglycan-associated protein
LIWLDADMLDFNPKTSLREFERIDAWCILMLSFMRTFNIYQPVVQESRTFRGWLLWALAASLAVHACLFLCFRNTKLEHFEPYTMRLVPRAFTSLGRVDIDPKLLETEQEKKEEPQASPPTMPNIPIPDEKPSAQAEPDEMVFKPTAPEMVKTIATEKPKVDNSSLQALAQTQQKTTAELDSELNSVREQLIKDKPKLNSKSLLKLGETTKPGMTAPANGATGIPGTKSLDEALAGTGGGLHSGDRIGIRGGALFEFDKADLRSDAIDDLRKLASIVRSHPNAIFTIEGYADSIGTPQYNLDLSQRRADAVKAWLLVNIAGVNPFKIEAFGRGSTNFIVQPSDRADKEEQDRQEKNRRVEISIKFPR